MAIVNLTPDSFLPESRADADAVTTFRATVQKLVDEGADILDFGAESTRPGSDYVEESEELRRLLPAIENAREVTNLPISVDTRKARVAKAALEMGANIINDISALRDDPALLEVAFNAKAPVILMHMAGTPKTMQSDPRYEDVVSDVLGFLLERAAFAKAGGVEQVVIDPGIGFGKTVEHNLILLRALDRFVQSGIPVLVGHSRKGFIGKVLGDSGADSADRFAGSLGVAAWAAMGGAAIIRTHDVRATKNLVRMIAAIESVELAADNKRGVGSL